ncbi:MAG TPA: Hsp33 family molecular chaperone HslO [Armatimonadota bacterium]|nr:Hsp33 family molecular chaperone HslO [Armatimonadota bacterium]
MPRRKDKLIRAIAAAGQVRAFAVNSTALCEQARRIQDALPAATAALGRVLSAAVMLAATIKEGERISLRVEGDGPVEGLFAQAWPNGRVRGYLRNPRVNPPSRGNKLDVGRAVGRHGELVVIRDLGMREPYVGRVPLQSGEIGDDLAYYFAVSEQQPAAVGLGVLVETDNAVAAAGGYLIQPLPGADPEIVDRLEATIRAAPPPSELIITRREPEKLLDVLLAGMDWQLLEEVTPRFSCGCTRAKSRRALRALAVNELRELVAHHEPVTVSCDFCGKGYRFETADIQALLAAKEQEAT